MKRAWTIFRAIAVGLLLLAVVVPTSLYVLLSMEPVQRGVRDTASHELSKIGRASCRERVSSPV